MALEGSPGSTRHRMAGTGLSRPVARQAMPDNNWLWGLHTLLLTFSLSDILTAHRGPFYGSQVLAWWRCPRASEKPGGALTAPLLFHRRQSARLRKGVLALMERLVIRDRPGLKRYGFGKITGIHPEPYGRYRAIEARSWFRPCS